MQAALLAVVLLLGAAGCGGTVVISGGGGSDGTTGAGGFAGTSGSAGADAGAGAAGADAGPDAGWTRCSAPDWLACGTPACPAGRPGCSACGPAEDPGLLSICAESLLPRDYAEEAPDGTIILSEQSSFTTKPFIWDPVPFDAGKVVAAYGQAARLAYADRGDWTGEAIPEPTHCPSIPGVHTCGGYCGGCQVGETCTGRSPLHPYGLCIPDTVGVCSLVPGINGSRCKSDESCFVFTVQADHQEAADATGFCLPTAECQATAANLPGGGRCQ